MRTCASRTVRRVASVGMRGQHEPDGHVARAALELVRRHVSQQLERALERVARGAAGVRVLPAPPDAVVLLRDVRELEVEREGAEHERLLLRRRPSASAR